jgi:hypothetical protein
MQRETRQPGPGTLPPLWALSPQGACLAHCQVQSGRSKAADATWQQCLIFNHQAVGLLPTASSQKGENPANPPLPHSREKGSLLCLGPYFYGKALCGSSPDRCPRPSPQHFPGSGVPVAWQSMGPPGGKNSLPAHKYKFPDQVVTNQRILWLLNKCQSLPGILWGGCDAPMKAEGI